MKPSTLRARSVGDPQVSAFAGHGVHGEMLASVPSLGLSSDGGRILASDDLKAKLKKKRI
jgi:hypothetical protein